MSLEKELAKATELKPVHGKGRQKYLSSLVKAIEALDDPDWRKLSKPARTWYNKALKRDALGNTIPDFVEDEEEDEPKAKKSRDEDEDDDTEDEEEGEDEEDEDKEEEEDEEEGEGDEDEDEEKPRRSKKKSKSKDEDEDEEEDNEDEGDDDMPKSNNPKKAKKHAKADNNSKGSSKKKKLRHPPPVRPSKWKPEQRIRVLVKDNPKREDSESYKRFKLYYKNKTVGEFLKAGGTPGDLHWDVGHDFISVK